MEDGYDTKKWEEEEILVVYDSRLAEPNKTLVKRHFNYIDTIDHEGAVVINTMHYLTVGLFEHLEII